jgi:hypothetical protein
LNDAYRTLRHPIRRIEYLLKIEGLAARDPQESSKQVPPALLEEVFALNEELDEIRALRAGGAPEEEWRGRLTEARRPIDQKRAEHEAQIAALSRRWDAALERGSEDWRIEQTASGSAEAGMSGAMGTGARNRRAILAALRDRFLERNYISNLLAGIERELEATR